MKVLLVTSWRTACGIAEHSAMLKEAVEMADPQILIMPCPEMLDPRHASYTPMSPVDVLHLNYHAALHSRWTPDEIRRWQRVGISVVVTYHDSGVPNTEQCKAIAATLRPRKDAMVVHEPFDDLPLEKVRYWRMGVPDWTGAYQFENVIEKRRPMLGSIGFPFPWKNYEVLAQVTAEAGWDLLLIAPGATPEQEALWKQLNPRTTVCPTFLPQQLAVSWLAGCDASAFLYVCHNAGQSGAILQGIAARKPVIALAACRQFRALFDDKLGRTAITWCESIEEVTFALEHFVRIERVSPQIVALAEQESWAKLGRRYAQLYRGLVV